MKKKSAVVFAFTPETDLKRKVRTHLKKLGFDTTQDEVRKAPSSSKETIQALHLERWNAILKKQRQILPETLPSLKKYFSSDDEVDRRDKLHDLTSVTRVRKGQAVARGLVTLSPTERRAA
jgi:hypothetical protein